MDVELHDWEVLDDSDSPHNTTTTTYLDEIEPDIIRSDHFSLHPHQNHLQHVTDHPSLIDPVSDTNKNEFPSAGGSEDCRCVDNESSNNELGEIEIEIASTQVACDESLSDSGEIDEKLENQARNEDALVEKMKPDGEERNNVAVGVWWKLPLDLLKYCLFKASPVWTISAAAAMIGVVILGRRLYKMKQKTRILQPKVTLDDKKVSQVMSRAARLNEAFSVVKRAPIVRPSLPAAGNAQWPMIALR